MAGSDGRVGPTVALVLAMAVGVGLANGVLISILGTDAFVTTLATMLLVQGAALVYTQGSPANDLTHGFRQISEGDFLGIPISIYCFAGLVVALWLVLSRTVWGHRIYAVGTNAVTTRLSAQPVVTTVIAAYVACSVLAAVGGLFLVARLGTGDTAAGSGWELKAISAVLIGGIPFGGGRGSILGPVGGVLVLVTLLNLVDLLALPNYSTLIVNGAAIIVGVALYSRHRSP
jgi:ribose transport system permease protein